MKILVTGGAGFIGSHVADAYLAAGHEVLVVDDLSTGLEEHVPKGARFAKADVRAPEAAAAIASFKPDVLNHHAAQADVRVSVANPRSDLDVNVGGIVNLLEAARLAGTKRVVFSSTGGAMYGDDDPHPTAETVPARPLSPYGCAKRSSELYLAMYGALYGLHGIAFRYANVYGPRQGLKGEAGVIGIFSAGAIAGKELLVFGDGTARRDYVYVDDVVQANVLALATTFRGEMNIGTGVETDVNTIHRLVTAAAKTDRPAKHVDARPGELQRSSLDATLADQVLGWKAKVPLADGIARTVAWFAARRGPLTA